MPRIDGVTERLIAMAVPDAGRRGILLDLALLRRHAGARRALERAAGEVLMVRSDVLDDGSWSHRHKGLSRTERGRGAEAERLRDTDLVYAPIQITPDVVWEIDTLRADMPETIRGGVDGRRLGEVVVHPALDPDAIASTAEKGHLRPPALLRVAATSRRIEPVQGIDRLRLIAARVRMAFDDSTIAGIPRRAALAYGGLAAMLIVVHVAGWHGMGVLNHVLGAAAVVYLGFGFINACTGRSRSWLGLMGAEDRHQAEMLKRHRRSLGQPED